MANITRGPLPQDNFTQISNGWLRDKRLSWKARGLLAWLTSHNSGFEVSLSRIVAASDRDGRESARSAIEELETCGYLLRAKDRDKAGRITSASYTLVDACPDCHEDPNAQVTPIVGFSDVGKTDVGKTDVGPADVGPADVGTTDSGKTRTYKKNNSSKKTNTQKTNSAELALVPDPGGVLVKPDTAQSVLADYIDWCTAQGRPVSSQVKGHLAKQIKQLLADGFEVKTVKLGLAEWHERRSNPSSLPSFVHHAPTRTPASNGQRPNTAQRLQQDMSTLEILAREEGIS